MPHMSLTCSCISSQVKVVRRLWILQDERQASLLLMVCGEKHVQISALVKTEHENIRSHHEPVSAEKSRLLRTLKHSFIQHNDLPKLAAVTDL
ncbi:hypothetical protein pdam_00000126 [Pocillopora damicornis]|uniref:Uncharacterized protein n=1 Tax=Pocillopora damicornis TaxID=46731 RepID=A0A3M6UXA7_POCDA|nr:hypothetical protein pdam_00000126 [Pocillopora damicornis]